MVGRQCRMGEIGILNNAATCYMDSVIQCLAHIPSFGKWFLTCLPYLSEKIDFQKSNRVTRNDNLVGHLEHQFTVFTGQILAAL